MTLNLYVMPLVGVGTKAYPTGDASHLAVHPLDGETFGGRRKRMASVTRLLAAAYDAQGEARIEVVYDDVTLAVTAINVMNSSTKPATVTLNNPSGVLLGTRTLPANQPATTIPWTGLPPLSMIITTRFPNEQVIAFPFSVAMRWG